eukprot:2256907-Ditylum_brightwellii.AAC.1
MGTIRLLHFLNVGHLEGGHFQMIGRSAVKQMVSRNVHYFWNKPFLRSVLVSRVPYNALVNAMPNFLAFAVYDEQGGLVEVYQDDEDVYIYLGSWWTPFLGRVLKEDLILADK